MDSKEKDQLSFIGSMDQLGAALRAIAPAIAAYYHSLRKAGIPEESALSLTMQIQSIFMSQAKE